jgi:hypothetical protein
MGKVLRFGEGGVIETEGEVVVAAGSPAPAAPDKAALISQLAQLSANALVAQNRLTNLVDPTHCAQTVQDLITRYGALQAKLTELGLRVQTITDRPDSAAAVIADGTALGVEVQGFIEGVEALIAKYPLAGASSSVPTSAAGKRSMTPEQKKKLMPFLFLGGIAVLVAGGGYLIWRQRDQQTKASQRASKRAFGALPARGGGGGRKKAH